MGRILALLGAAGLCVFLTATPDLPQSSMQRLWAEGSPDSWASAGTRLSAIGGASVGYMCPMDRDVSSKTPGFCPRCGMKLVSGTPEAKESPVSITTEHRAIKPGE